ncbi:S1-like domain-containing RNA-binding protein [Brevibacillus choshinensis]|nr:S1-like domain-containing RNA-binding protein [Brevibacillus choshinensis]MED4752643.1 S1-like domain-containing RNA-binding protein [Brevibacillus choshinensis]
MDEWKKVVVFSPAGRVYLVCMMDESEELVAMYNKNKQVRTNTPPSQLQAGMTLEMTVARKTDIGYFLRSDKDEVFLHKNEAHGPLDMDDEVEVFLYHDHENRLAATMDLPYVGMGEYGWLEVVDLSSRMGVFLDNGINKHLLVFVDDLPKLRDEWPRPGDRMLVALKQDKLGRLLAKPVTEQEVMQISVLADESMKNKNVEATVYKVIAAGAFLLTEDDYIMFIHRDEMTERMRLGQTVRCRVSFVREDGRLNGSMRERKELQYGEDAEKLLRYMNNRDGAMPYTDKTEADIIQEKFQMSKSSFKRALGKLMKERRVEQVDGWTKVIKND